MMVDGWQMQAMASGIGSSCVNFITCQSPTELHHPSTTDGSGFLLKSFYSEALVNEVLGL